MTNNITFRGRKAVSIENEFIRVTVMVEGGHIAEIFHKKKQISPLWQPIWPTMEPSLYTTAEEHPEYGNDFESKLLAGIMGHNICLDLFGGPSKEEGLAGLNVHGEAGSISFFIFYFQ